MNAPSAQPSGQARILVVDDTPVNLKLLSDLLRFKGYEVETAASGQEALDRLALTAIDLVLLDVTMPGMSGYEVCQRLREAPQTALLPVVMVTSLDPKEERVKGIEAGADDFLSKPINQAELLARVRSLLRIKQLTDQNRAQATELSEFNRTLQRRVDEQVAQLERLGRLKNFFSAPLAESILDAGGEKLLQTHRSQVSVVFADLRGFTAFTESQEPEDVMEVLGSYHRAMGSVIKHWKGTLAHFSGDGMMIFFNDPVPMERPTEAALGMAWQMQQEFEPLCFQWRKIGVELGLGIGVAEGYATLGAIGFEGRWEYAAIGAVCNLSARLCAEATAGQILVDRRTRMKAEETFLFESIGDLNLKGIPRPVTTFQLVALRHQPSDT